MRPAVWTASVCISAPLALAMAAISAMGCRVPISLLACMTLTRAVSGVTASRTASTDTMPEASTGMVVMRNPRRPSAAIVARTASCSMAVVTR